MSDLIDVSPPGQLANGTLAAARAFFYDAGTTTPRTVYADEAETIPHPLPLVADADGLFPQVFVSGAAVKVVMQDSTGATLYTLDPCVKTAAAGVGASAISFTPTVDLPFTDVQSAIVGAAASAASGFTPFGLGVTGSVALIADIDATATATGQYRFDATTTGTYPTGVTAANTGAIMVVRETSGSAWMWLYHDTTDRVFIRRMTSSTWGAWRENITADIGATQGDILYRSATAWTRLAAGTAGQLLQTGGAGANPSWVTNPSPVKAWVNFRAAPISGTYSRTGTTVTVTITAHGLSTGMIAALDFTTGLAADGSYTVSVVDANTFTLTTVASGTTSGNVTMNLFIRASSNVTSVTYTGVGDYTVNITSAISDANYAATATAGDNSSNRLAAQISNLSTTSFRIYVLNHGNGLAADAAVVSAMVVR
jgi:hypothetical protein